MSAVETRSPALAAAERRAERIRLVATTFMEARDKLARLITEAQENNDHEVMGYRSWTEYIAALCSDTPLMRLSRDERKVIVADLAEQGMSTRAIAPVVGAHRDTVAQDLRDAGGGFPPPVEPRNITGTDGKTYTRPTPVTVDHETGEIRQTKPNRRALTDQFRDATRELEKATERMERLVSDDRFSRNREVIAELHQAALGRMEDTLGSVLSAIEGDDQAPAENWHTDYANGVRNDMEARTRFQIEYLEALAANVGTDHVDGYARKHMADALRAQQARTNAAFSAAIAALEDDDSHDHKEQS
jgi:transposase-like protein